MATILTPLSLWEKFNSEDDINVSVIKEESVDGVKYTHVNFLGRQTEKGRVKIYGVLAENEDEVSQESILLLQGSKKPLNVELIAYFVSLGYSVLSVDYRGDCGDSEYFTEYPEDIFYANLSQCGRTKSFVDDTADKTCWYEWVAVGIYARKFLIERYSNAPIGLVGIKDGGEIAWKLSFVRKFDCAVTVCASGWKAYSECSKLSGEEPELSSERYNFIAGIDSQSYAPYVDCPILMLCTTNAEEIDCDRQFDTFTRINKEYYDQSSIAYSMRSTEYLDESCLKNLSMFLDKNIKQRQIFIAKPAEVTVTLDETGNLVARAEYDNEGEIDEVGAFYSEDIINCHLRDWHVAEIKSSESDFKSEFFLNVNNNVSLVFVICYAKYTNGYTAWSKLAVKKIGGVFRNSHLKQRLLYSADNGVDCFISKSYFLNEGCDILHKASNELGIAERDGMKGLHSNGDILSLRLSSPTYLPTNGTCLKIDVYVDNKAEMTFKFHDINNGETYFSTVELVDGVWQSLLLECSSFRDDNGKTMESFKKGYILYVECNNEFLVNNFLWL